MTDQEILALLDNCVEGLMFMSESDFPLTPFVWPAEEVGGELTGEALRRHRGYPADAKIERIEAAAFFERLTRIEEGLSPQRLKAAAGFRELWHRMSETLTDLRVFRLGRIRIDVFVAGRAPSGAWAGVSSTVIET